MKAREIVREAGRDIASGTTRVALLAAMFTFGVGGVICADALSVNLLQGQVDGWRQAGGGVEVYTAPGAIDGRACASLAQVAGVVGAGAVREVPGGLAFAQLGTGTIPWYETTPGLTAVLGVQPSAARVGAQTGPGVILSPAAADALGRAAGARVAVAGEEVTVAATLTLPDDGRVTPFQYAALTVVPASGTFDSCWLAVWPPDAGLSHLVTSTMSLSATQDARADLAALNPTIAATIDPAAVYGQRPTRWAPLAIAIIAFALGVVAVRTRRLEIASALHARVSRSAVTRLHLLEAGAWAVLGACLIAPCALYAARTGASIDPHAIDVRSALLILLGVVNALLGTLAALLVTREDHLLDYFKTR